MRAELHALRSMLQQSQLAGQQQGAEDPIWLTAWAPALILRERHGSGRLLFLRILRSFTMVPLLYFDHESLPA